MAGAVPQMSIMASETLSGAIGNRMNISNGYNPVLEQAFQSGLTLWITPLWKNQSGCGMEACKLDYGFKTNIGGVAIGADYSFNENIKAGLAFNIGGGYAKSSGDLSRTENHINFWGLGLYGSTSSEIALFRKRGFLSGDSFPRLPLSIYIPAYRFSTAESDRFLNRDPSLAISEFGLRSSIEHKGYCFSISYV